MSMQYNTSKVNELHVTDRHHYMYPRPSKHPWSSHIYTITQIKQVLTKLELQYNACIMYKPAPSLQLPFEMAFFLCSIYIKIGSSTWQKDTRSDTYYRHNYVHCTGEQNSMHNTTMACNIFFVDFCIFFLYNLQKQKSVL